ncbi:MAG: DNA polymerase III subunit epsilon [Hyphomicrobiales bacterium]
MREIVLDTETTGLDPAQGHRVVEIGALELINHLPSGRSFQAYINPERPIPPEAEAVHGLGNVFLKDKPVFAAVAEEFLGFIADAALVIHNASFDVAFLNAELGLLGKPPILGERVVDTLALARQKHPMGPNSLDALCKRYAIDNSKRTRHGALLDSELLADVYLELIGGKQTALTFATAPFARPVVYVPARPGLTRLRPLPSRLSEKERAAHGRFVDGLGSGALWKKFAD